MHLYPGLMQPVAAAVKIISPLENQIIEYRNQSVLFNCTVTPASSSGKDFQWFRDRTPLRPDDVQATPLWSSFELKNLSVQEEGEYTCIYDSGTDSVKVYLACKLMHASFLHECSVFDFGNFTFVIVDIFIPPFCRNVLPPQNNLINLGHLLNMTTVLLIWFSWNSVTNEPRTWCKDRQEC